MSNEQVSIYSLDATELKWEGIKWTVRGEGLMPTVLASLVIWKATGPWECERRGREGWKWNLDSNLEAAAIKNQRRKQKRPFRKDLRQKRKQDPCHGSVFGRSFQHYTLKRDSKPLSTILSSVLSSGSKTRLAQTKANWAVQKCLWKMGKLLPTPSPPHGPSRHLSANRLKAVDRIYGISHLPSKTSLKL